ncbi:MAG: hypothetical protein IJ437_01675 [Clostridia bacterium]|nr:hypothetical protein [Clostridia bacterium]
MAKKNIGLEKDESLGMKEPLPLPIEAGKEIAKGVRKRRIKKDESFKEALKTLLSLQAPPDSLADALRQTPLGNSISYREAILLAQIIKAYNGDTQAAVFIRDSSGNKLKDGEKDEKKKKFEDFF